LACPDADRGSARDGPFGRGVIGAVLPHVEHCSTHADDTEWQL
jgi:hypothetical protein